MAPGWRENVATMSSLMREDRLDLVGLVWGRFGFHPPPAHMPLLAALALSSSGMYCLEYLR
jgi:hypothetical protein